MDRRLLGLAAVTAAAAAVPGFPVAAVVLAFALPVATVAGAALGGPLAGVAVVLPTAGILAFGVPDGLPAFAASAVAGVILGALVRMGRSAGASLAWGTVPIALWTVGLAMSGFDPVSPEMAAQLERVWSRPATGGDAARMDTEVAIGLIRNTWVGLEVVFSAAALALAYRVAARLFPERGWRPFAPFARFDLPDALVAVVLAGLAAVLAVQYGAPPVLAGVGGNLLMASGVLYAVRGVAVQAFWLERAGVGRRAGAVLLVVGALVFLPVFPVVAAGLGLFDTWFDFRRVRGPEGGNNPLSFRHSSSDDGT